MRFFDDERDELRNYIAQRHLVEPTTVAVQIDRPTSSTFAYNEDCKWFTAQKTRNWLLRIAFRHEFEFEYLPHPTFPSLWVAVRREVGFHIRHAFWRGDQPFLVKPTSDFAAINIYSACIEKGGIDVDACRRFFRSNQ
jgi:hypothetical protein